MKSIYGKLILGFLASILFSFSIAGYFSLRKNSDELGRLTVEELNNSTELIADFLAMIDNDNLPKVLSGYASTSEVSFFIETQGHKEVYGTLSGRQLTTKEHQLLEENLGKTISLRDSSMRKLAKSFEVNGQEYIVFVQKDIGKKEMVFVDSAMIAVFCMLIAGSITFLVIADIIVKPISRLNKATNELSKGNYRVRVNYSGNDEIARLNRSFNQMAQQLAKQEETRQQFISDVSHEFQTPLTAIQGFATILKNEKLTDEQRQKYADIILFHSKRLSTLSKNMLQLTILDGEDVKIETSEFSLIEQLNRVIETQDNLAMSKNIEIEFNIPKNDVIIEADESRLEQVWINLVNNAIKYTNDNGVVTISIKKTSKEVEVTIQDTGVGMSKEAISHIFERFYRQDKSRSVEGNGLGLSIVKRIIDLHQGTIDVKSREDGGSQFIVRLPQVRSFHIGERLIKKDNHS
ncbi:sensor histidine kinase [Candidatus Stoquefichus massiliensis]|uniref:sensor histidine kinase n=1 Tax=Candidatus Stoquefichus massiliensis TaxID=1470350 RepID=UPI000489F764|nr:HAMP domain-containing sensor histidine kinase [Candidatus Stoquefichus massiliensis]